MHKYMRAIGFGSYQDRKVIKELLKDVVASSDERAYTYNQNGVMLGVFCKEFANNIGIAVCGEFDEEDRFIYEYYFPYLKGKGITTYEDITIERHAAKESFAGICEDVKIGISLIFYLQNMIPYVKAQTLKQLPIKGTSLTLSGLSLSGTIIFPIMKDQYQIEKIKNESNNRNKLIEAARKGDEVAIESLTLDDMDMYTSISKKIQKEDVLTLVDTYFMPFGVECDHYSILGEILEINETQNKITNEKLYNLTLYCNEVVFDICIHQEDLLGEPEVGRRFKGIIWLQGEINYPENK